MVNKNKLNELFKNIDNLLFYLDGCVISKKKYNQIRKDINNDK